jgi:hypothetical protein
LGFTDLQKYSDLAAENPALKGIKGAIVGNVGGALFYETNSLSTDTGLYSDTSGIGYNTYVVGHQAFIASSLGKTNLNQKNFSVKVQNFPAGSNSLDPAGLIAAAAA